MGSLESQQKNASIQACMQACTHTDAQTTPKHNASSPIYRIGKGIPCNNWFLLNNNTHLFTSHDSQHVTVNEHIVRSYWLYFLDKWNKGITESTTWNAYKIYTFLQSKPCMASQFISGQCVDDAAVLCRAWPPNSQSWFVCQSVVSWSQTWRWGPEVEYSQTTRRHSQDGTGNTRASTAALTLQWHNVDLFTCLCAPLLLKSAFSFVIYSQVCSLQYVPSVLWRCWLGGSKGIRPVKNRVVGCWGGYLPGAKCRLAYGPDDATATHCLLLQ